MDFVRCSLYVIALLVFCSAASAAEPPVAIVMAVTGSTSPSAPAMTELYTGSPISLGTARLTFLHYTTCKLVTVFGGTLTVTRTGFETNGKIASNKDGPCPRIHQLEGGTTAGIIMRGDGATPLPVNSEVIFVGQRAAKVTAASISPDTAEHRPGSDLKIDHNKVRLATGQFSLTLNTRYILSIRVSDRQQPIDFAFIAAAPREADSLTLMRVD